MPWLVWSSSSSGVGNTSIFYSTLIDLDRCQQDKNRRNEKNVCSTDTDNTSRRLSTSLSSTKYDETVTKGEEVCTNGFGGVSIGSGGGGGAGLRVLALNHSLQVELPSSVRGADQRSRGHVLETEPLRELLPAIELLWGDISLHGHMAMGRAEVLTKGDDIDTSIANISNGCLDVLVTLAQPQHQRRLREDIIRLTYFLGVFENSQGLLVTSSIIAHSSL